MKEFLQKNCRRACKNRKNIDYNPSSDYVYHNSSQYTCTYYRFIYRSVDMGGRICPLSDDLDGFYRSRAGDAGRWTLQDDGGC